ncbi:MAG TPA: O-antigen ligase family protein [Candidatus Humimicrobiaceae bacterium]|nr:O-antigen ligase family protein [Candidatus Humimicrobiaceae bacterium]
MGKRSREKRERFASQSLGEDQRERQLRPKTHLEGLCLFIIATMTCLALFTPLIMNGSFFFPFVSPKSLYFMGLVQVIFFTWLFLIFYFPQYRPRRNPLLIALIVFLLILTLSTLFGENPSYSFWSKPERMTGLLMWFHLFAFFLVTSSVFRKSDWFKIFFLSTFIGLILSFIAFFADNPAMRGGATIGNSSFLGTYLLFNIFLALWLFLSSQSRYFKIYSAVASVIMFYAVFSINARAATYSILAGLALLFLLYLSFGIQKRYLNILGKISLAVILIAFLIGAFYIFQPDNFIHNWFVEKASYARLVVWEKAWNGFLERPLLGWGPENFEFVFIKNFNPCMFLPVCGGEIWFDRAHNIILDTLVSTGILGILSYLGLFLAIFYLLWKKYFTLSTSSASDNSERSLGNNFENNTQKIKISDRGVSFWTTGIFSVVLIAYSVQNLTVFDMVSSYLMFFLVLGFIASMIAPREMAAPEKFISPKPWFLSVFLILFIPAFIYFIIQPLKTSYCATAALRAPAASEERLDLYKKSLESSPLGKYQIREFFGQTTLEFAQSEQVRQVSAENFKKELDFVIEELEKSVKESPLDFRSYLRLGQLYNSYAVLIDQTKISQAERVLEKAIEVSPTNQQGYWSLAQARLYQGKFDEALSLAEKAVTLEPNLLQSHLIVVRIAQIMEDDELAERKIKEAIEINPGWATSLVPAPN